MKAGCKPVEEPIPDDCGPKFVYQVNRTEFMTELMVLGEKHLSDFLVFLDENNNCKLRGFYTWMTDL